MSSVRVRWGGGETHDAIIRDRSDLGRRSQRAAAEERAAVLVLEGAVVWSVRIAIEMLARDGSAGMDLCTYRIVFRQRATYSARGSERPGPPKRWQTRPPKLQLSLIH